MRVNVGRAAGLAAAVALCAAIHAWPLGWGLPSAHGWAPDELVLAAAYAPWLRGAPDAGRHHVLFRVGRVVSLLMAGTVVLVYLCGRELFGHLPALFAALVAGLSAPFTYYAKVANLDVPYLFWFSPPCSHTCACCRAIGGVPM